MTTRIALILIASLAAPLTAHADSGPETKRDVIVAKHDLDGNKRLDGKEMKEFKKENPKMYDALVAWCPDAKDHPKKNGVELPATPDKKQLQCKKSHVSRLFLNAWTAEGAPVEAPAPEVPDQPSRASDGSPR